MSDEREIARFFDCCETPGQHKMNTRISRKARAELVRAVESLGLESRTVLEVGCGAGDLTRELVRLGASRAVGIDLAEKTLDVARKRAADEHLEDRTVYRVGNGAKDELQPHDIVVLDKVICCYPDWSGLIDNTSRAAQSVYGFVIPRSEGLSSIVVRAFMAIMRFTLKLRKCGFTPFVHDYRKIHARLEEHGFQRTLVNYGPIWMTAVYARA